MHASRIRSDKELKSFIDPIALYIHLIQADQPAMNGVFFHIIGKAAEGEEDAVDRSYIIKDTLNCIHHIHHFLQGNEAHLRKPPCIQIHNPQLFTVNISFRPGVAAHDPQRSGDRIGKNRAGHDQAALIKKVFADNDERIPDGRDCQDVPLFCFQHLPHLIPHRFTTPVRFAAQIQPAAVFRRPFLQRLMPEGAV